MTLADTLDTLAANLDEIETDNARALRSITHRRTALNSIATLQEALMAASENLDAAVAREEAAIAAEESTLARIHTRIQEQRDLIATLRGQISAGNAAAQATIQQLDTLSSRIEADTAAAESDTMEPIPAPAPAPAP
jgi:chromosome segregation ATPase